MRAKASAIVAGVAILLSGFGYADSHGSPLESLEWERRVLLLFADQPADPWAYRQRLEILQDRCDFNNRDLILLEVYGTDAPARATGLWLDGSVMEEVSLQTFENAALRAFFGVESGYSLLLVGKDGGEKRRELLPVSVHKIYAQIDGMPMRQREMRDDNCAEQTQGS